MSIFSSTRTRNISIKISSSITFSSIKSFNYNTNLIFLKIKIIMSTFKSKSNFRKNFNKFSISRIKINTTISMTGFIILIFIIIIPIISTYFITFNTINCNRKTNRIPLSIITPTINFITNKKCINSFSSITFNKSTPCNITYRNLWYNSIYIISSITKSFTNTNSIIFKFSIINFTFFYI